MIDDLARGSALAAFLLAQNTFNALIMRGLIEPDQAREVLDSALLNLEKTGDVDASKHARALLTIYLQSLENLPPMKASPRLP